MRIPHQVVSKSKHLLFQVDNHNVFILSHTDKEFECETLQFYFMEDDVKVAIAD